MGWPLLLAFAVGPVLGLLHVIWSVDRHKEPIRNVLRYLFVGALTVIPAFIAEVSLHGAYRGVLGANYKPSLIALLFAMVFGVALVEEACKRFGLLMLARKDPEINEPFDWVVYAVTISLGFAMVENLSYVMAGGVAVGIARALTAVPFHALNGTIMGHHLAKASRLRGAAANRERRLSLIEPTLWHGLYDFFAMGAALEGADNHLLNVGLLGAAFLVLVVCQWIVCVRRIRAMRLIEMPVPPLLYPIEALRRAMRIPGRR